MARLERLKAIVLEHVRQKPGLTCLELAALAERHPSMVASALGYLCQDGLVWGYKDTKLRENRYWPAIDPSHWD